MRGWGPRVAPVGFALLLVLAPAAAGLGPPPASTTYGDVEFPKDEHRHADGWDFWWGAAHLVMESGNRYTVGIAFDSLYGLGLTGHELFAHQGPYEGLSVTSMDGPAEWGHAGEPLGRYVRRASDYVPGASDLLRFETFDTADDLKDIGRWERTTLDSESYHLLIDNDEAKVHPTDERVKLVVDLQVDMKGPPLLAGGTGRWWYGIPETYGYPSRSFQYMQAADHVTGTLELGPPDEPVVETVDPDASTILITHEYDASPEDLWAGLALAESTQLHPRYAQYYQGGMPWELLFIDLDNGAQLMVTVLAFHDTPKGTLKPLTGPDQPTYRVLATLRLPSGESVPLDEAVRVEHLSYRTLIGRVPTFWVTVHGIWKQAWDYRVSYQGDMIATPDGGTIDVPPFDLGVAPQIGRDEPAPDTAGNRLVQRVPYDVGGSYDGCPVGGFGWSELIINWYGHEDHDPWFTGGSAPPVPGGCGAPPPMDGPPGDLEPPATDEPPPSFTPEGCSVFDEASSPCTYTAAGSGGIVGYGSGPGGWTVTIERAGLAEPIVIPSHGSGEQYACGAIRGGDVVTVEIQAGSWVATGNPGICF